MFADRDPAGGFPSMPRRTTILLAGRLTSAGTSVVVLVLVGQMRGPTALGGVAIGLAMGAILAAVSDLGANSLLVREIARRPKRAGALLVGLALFRLPTLSLAILGGALAARVAGGEASAVVLPVAVGLALQSCAELSRGLFMAQQRFGIAAGHFVIENLAWFAVVASLLLLAPHVPTAAVFGIGLGVLTASILAGFVLAYTVGGAELGLPTGSEVLGLARSAPPFAAFSVIGTAHTRLDTVMIGVLMPGGLAAAGSYFAATRLIAALEYVPEAAARGAFPELARRFGAAPEQVAPLLGRIAGGLLLIGAGIPAVLIPAGDIVLRTLFSTPVESAWVLGALSLVVPVRYLAYLFGVTLTSADAQGMRVAAASVALVAVVAINGLGISLLGLVAPVLAALIAASSVGSLYALFVRRRFGSIGLSPRLVVSVAACSLLAGVLGVVVRALVGGEVGIVAAGAVALATYLLTTVLGPVGPLLGARRASAGPGP